MARVYSGDLAVNVNIKMRLEVVGLCVEWIQLVHWRDAVTTALNIGLPWEAVNVLSNWASIGILRNVA
jgi:hypothetical protein